MRNPFHTLRITLDMDCCVCFESFNTTTNVPLLVCDYGHSVCSSCSPSLNRCPFCRENVFSSSKRNIPLVNFLETLKDGPTCPQIPAADLQIDFENGLIRQGGNASVYSAEWNGASVAVKVVSVSANGVLKLERELSLMASLNHPLVIRVFGIVYLPQNRVGIVMERALHSLPAPTVTSPETLKHAIDIVNAVKYLHSMSIVHYALKPANILISNNHIKLTDFGTSRIVSSNTTIATTAAFTPKYAAPECLEKKVSPQSDVYSIGVILYEILCGREAYSGYTIMEIFGAKCRPCTFEFGQEVPSELKAIIVKACDVDKTKRPSLDDILNVLTKLNCSITTSVLSHASNADTFEPPRDQDWSSRKVVDSGVIQSEASDVGSYSQKRMDALRNSFRENQILVENVPKTNGDIDWDQLNELKELHLSRSDCSSLQGIQLLRELTFLCLSNCKLLTDIRPVIECANLTVLSLQHSSVIDISPLSRCKKLKNLHLSHTFITDLSPLSSCTNLSVLSLDYSHVTDISVLEKCRNLTYLILDFTEITDIRSLGSCTNLQSLSLQSTKIKDICPLSNCVKLYHLNLQSTQVSDISVLSNLTKLSSLNLSNTIVSDISVLSNCTRLISLNLEGTSVWNIVPLRNCTLLHSLRLDDRQMSAFHRLLDRSLWYSFLKWRLHK
ncbi:hypothetical protein RCL1_008227 [Eukaryota sp. TZLM3-RCL]